MERGRVLLTGTAAEIIPVVEVDGRKVGEGKPGSCHAVLFGKVSG